MKNISFELAKILKEKKIELWSCDGYAINRFDYYSPRMDSESRADPGDLVRDLENCEYDENAEIIFAPYQSQLQKYLRDKHQIYVEVIVFLSDDSDVPKFRVGISKLTEILPGTIGLTGSTLNDGIKYRVFRTYEDAFEEGLKGAIDLIEWRNTQEED
jgi:hypothetical protein